ncbi:MAG: hypothetical protein NC299_12120 [Lachnospiraceae bacterium]|nr:hypothetical protein [Ruminococcus sp.]MCM1276089.1 hypothetical protein [Lachnospiraceae bacterium]
MKSTELFDLLGEIDDRFYEEAKRPEEQQGVEIVREPANFRTFLSFGVPIAACLAVIAAVAVGAGIVSKRAGFVAPNDPDSSLINISQENSSSLPVIIDSASSSSEESSVPETVDKGLLDLDEYPPIDLDSVPDLKGTGLETQMTMQDKKLRKATLASIKCGDYELYMLGEFIHTDKSENDAQYTSKLYSYYVTLALAKDGKVVSTDSPHTRSVTMGQGGYVLDGMELSSYLEYYGLDYMGFDGVPLILFKYPNGTGCYETTFFSVADDELRALMGDFSGVEGPSMDMTAELTSAYEVDGSAFTLRDGDVLYTFCPENFGKNPYDNAPHFTVTFGAAEQGSGSKVGDMLPDYPELDMSQVPDVTENEYLPEAKLAEKQDGEYTLTIVGENLKDWTSYSKKFEYDEEVVRLQVGKMSVFVSKDGRILSKFEKFTTGAPSMLILDDAENYFPDIYRLKGGDVFRQTNDISMDYFYTIKSDGSVIEFENDYSAVQNFIQPELGYAPEPLAVLPEENAVILYETDKWTFDFDKRTAAKSYTTEPSIADYRAFDKNSLEVQPKVILDSKRVGEYTVYLLGDKVRSVLEANSNLFSYSDAYVAVEKNGKITAQDCVELDATFHAESISEYIQPFEMKGGVGIARYVDLENTTPNYHRFAVLSKIEDGGVLTQLDYFYNFAPAGANVIYVGEDFKVDYDKNAIVDDEGTITIDFENGTYSRS